MAIEEKDMLKLENFDLERPDVISANVEFRGEFQEEIKLQMEFAKPKLKEEIKIHNVELTRYGTSGSKRKELF
jgi:hypothetical protein